MPFCTNCGNQVASTDTFCGVCGQRQAPGTGPGTPPRSGGPDFMSRVSNREAAILCYIPVAGGIAAIIVLASARFRHNRDARFHAFQGLYLFVAYLLVKWVVSPMMHFGPMWGPERAFAGLLELALWIAWIFMLVKTSHRENFHLPIIGELAERSVAEQL
jgi:uncharacterized membrane protein